MRLVGRWLLLLLLAGFGVLAAGAHATAAVTLQFFGLTRQADACRFAGDQLEYIVAGETFEIARRDVTILEGACDSAGPMAAPTASLRPAGSSTVLPADAVLDAGELTLPRSAWTPPAFEPCDLRQSVPVSVRRVIDGDTIEVAMPSGAIEMVRYIGVNAPELNDPERGEEPGGRAAKSMNEALLRGKSVELAFDARSRDRYGRLLAHVLAEGVHVNRALVERGHAAASTPLSSACFADLFRGDERRAREARRGLWGKPPGEPVVSVTADVDALPPEAGDGGQSAPMYGGSFVSSTPAPAQGRDRRPVRVHGYTRKDGTYVAPHERSARGTKGRSGRR